ncbi:MAG TPA: methyltransferase domain-containing protein [Patescibacteria group bacterium]|nr:methyltransferase domain-containing protein [Patescibacteria group bacterium]
MSNVPRLILRKLTPTICVYPNPFKICEYWEINRRLAGQPEGTLLDLGCGGGLQTVLLSRKFRSTLGVDIDDSQFSDASQRLHRWNRGRVRFVCGDLLGLGLPSESIDAVVSFSVLEHIAHWRQVLAEIFRLLKPGGQLVISVDSLEGIEDASLVQTHREAYFVQHYFSECELEAVLRETGFRGVSVCPAFTSPLARQLFARGIREDFKFSRAESVVDSLRLSLSERKPSGRSKSLFLIADATK